MCRSLADEILAGEIALRDLVGKEEFNPNSWQQILEAFRERGVVIENTSKATLEMVDDELAELLLSYRHNTKLYNTYFTSIRDETKDGVLHPNYRQWGTRGRRFSAGAVNE
jgi:DNA polymerase I-like protein with 3'-5' exonuclease and polymerase domains